MKKFLMPILVAAMFSTGAFAKQNGKQSSVAKSKTVSTAAQQSEKPVSKTAAKRPAETTAGTVSTGQAAGSKNNSSTEPAVAKSSNRRESKKATVKPVSATRSAAVGKSAQKN